MNPEITQPQDENMAQQSDILEETDLTDDEIAASLGYITSISEQMMPKSEEEMEAEPAPDENIDQKIEEEVDKKVGEEMAGLKEELKKILEDDNEPEQETKSTELAQ